MTRARLPAGVFFFVFVIPSICAIGQEPEALRLAETEPETEAEKPSPSLPAVVGAALLEEARRYACDGAALVTSPLHWDGRDWTTFAAFAGSLGVLLATDQQTYVAIQQRRSATTDDISDVTTPFGQAYAWAVAGGMLAGGLMVKDAELRDTGRDAIEAAAPLHVEAVRELFLDHVTPVELRTLAEISERVVAKLDEDAS